MRLALAVASAGHQRQFRPDADEIGWQLRLQKKVQLQLPEEDHVKCSWCNCDCVPWTATRCASWLATDRSDVCHHDCCDPDGACVYPCPRPSVAVDPQTTWDQKLQIQPCDPDKLPCTGNA